MFKSYFEKAKIVDKKAKYVEKKQEMLKKLLEIIFENDMITFIYTLLSKGG